MRTCLEFKQVSKIQHESAFGSRRNFILLSPQSFAFNELRGINQRGWNTETKDETQALG